MNMKKTKGLILFLCVVLLLGCLPVQNTYAFERKDHDKYMCEVLFKNFLQPENKISIQDEIEALGCASYLAIDQFNGNVEAGTLHMEGRPGIVGHNENKYSLTQLMPFLNLMEMKSRKKVFAQ